MSFTSSVAAFALDIYSVLYKYKVHNRKCWTWFSNADGAPIYPDAMYASLIVLLLWFVMKFIASFSSFSKLDIGHKAAETLVAFVIPGDGHGRVCFQARFSKLFGRRAHFLTPLWLTNRSP